MITFVAVGLGFTVVNLATLGLTLKLYTEIFKEIAQQRRTHP